MKNITKTLLTAVFVAAGFSAFGADELSVMQDAHGRTHVLYAPAPSDTTSVALFTHGHAISNDRTMEDSRELMATTSSNQHAQTFTRFELR